MIVRFSIILGYRFKFKLDADGLCLCESHEYLFGHFSRQAIVGTATIVPCLAHQIS